jgi:DNA-binding phage protein
MNIKETITAVASTRGLTITTLSKVTTKSRANLEGTLRHGNPSLSFLKEMADAMKVELAFIDRENGNTYKL